MPPQAKEDGTADGKMTSLALLHLRFAELAALLFRYAAEPTRNCTNLFLQWDAITAKLRAPTGALRDATVGTIWEMRLSIIGTGRIVDAHLREPLIKWAGLAKREYDVRVNCK